MSPRVAAAGAREYEQALPAFEQRRALAKHTVHLGVIAHRGAAGLTQAGIRERSAASGGWARITFNPMRGTRFHLALRLAGGRKRARPGSPAPAERVIRVLVVDDHRIVREGIATLLGETDGIEVVDQAGDGQEALEKARALRPDVVVMDVNMPRMNGIEATRRIRAELPAVRVIGLSIPDAGHSASILRAGAAAFISKGGDPGHLIETIARCAAG